MNIEIPPFRRKHNRFPCTRCGKRIVVRTGCGYCDECIWHVFTVFRDVMHWPVDAATRDAWDAWHATSPGTDHGPVLLHSARR